MNRFLGWTARHAPLLVSASLLGATGCIGFESDPDAAELEEIGEVSEAVVVPAKGTAATLDFASWNLEWFGDSNNGPSNETLQLDNVRDVINGSDMDIWGVIEVVSTTHFQNLVAQLPGYTGFLANDPSVINGSAYYSNAEQKVGLIYKSSIVTTTSRKVILTANDFNFAGRPPLEIGLNVTLNGATESVILIVMHAKCCSDSDSYQRRLDASSALKSYLDTTYPTQKVWVIGDINDDVDTSIKAGSPSPYANFVGDPARYTFPTKALSDAGIATTTSYPDAIDHHLNSNEVYAIYSAGSAEAYRVDNYISNYGTSTSDHYPVLTRYTWSGPNVILNEVLANEPGSSTAGEFVEIVNVGGASANIAGWTISDSTSVRHTFPAGTTLLAGKAIVVFGGSSGIPGGLTNAVAASTGALSLNNGGDTVTLKDAANVVKGQHVYGALTQDGLSVNRNPDGSPVGPFANHNTVGTGNSSPGKRANSTPW